MTSHPSLLRLDCRLPRCAFCGERPLHAIPHNAKLTGEAYRAQTKGLQPHAEAATAFRLGTPPVRARAA